MNTKKLLVTIMLAAIMVMPLVACEGNVEPATPVATAEVTEAPEPTEEVVEPEVTEETAPTEEVVEPEVTEEVVEDNPNVIDGIDFTDMYNKQAPLEDVIDKQAKYDTMRIFAVSGGHVYAILQDGDYFTQDEENINNSTFGYYSYFIYAPKKIVNIEKIGGNDISFYTQSDLEIDSSSKVVGSCGVRYESTGTDLECGAKVTYEDGTEETITIFVTKDYVIE